MDNKGNQPPHWCGTERTIAHRHQRWQEVAPTQLLPISLDLPNPNVALLCEAVILHSNCDYRFCRVRRATSSVTPSKPSRRASSRKSPSTNPCFDARLAPQSKHL